jgi:hypothetical protein
MCFLSSFAAHVIASLSPGFSSNRVTKHGARSLASLNLHVQLCDSLHQAFTDIRRLKSNDPDFTALKLLRRYFVLYLFFLRLFSCCAYRFDLLLDQLEWERYLRGGGQRSCPSTGRKHLAHTTQVRVWVHAVLKCVRVTDASACASLAENRIGDKGAEAFAQLLRRNPTLVYLK